MIHAKNGDLRYITNTSVCMLGTTCLESDDHVRDAIGTFIIAVIC